MAENKTIYLRNHLTSMSFVEMNVSTHVTESEAQKVSLTCQSPPENELLPLHHNFGYSFGTSFACIGHKIFGIGGTRATSSLVDDSAIKRMSEPISDVTIMKTKHPSEGATHRLSSMKEARCGADVFVVAGKIYVFGGLPVNKHNDKQCDWAECFNPYKNEWKSLREPLFRIPPKDRPFVLPIDDGKIFVGCIDITRDAMVYDSNTDKWDHYKLFNPRNYLLIKVSFRSVFVEADSTIYWIFNRCLHAVDLKTGIYYWGKFDKSVLSDMPSERANSLSGPFLMHLKDGLFCFLTVYDKEPYTSERSHGVVECTKFEVSRADCQRYEGILNIRVLGYQSHDCKPMWSLTCGVPAVEEIHDDESNKKRYKRRLE